MPFFKQGDLVEFDFGPAVGREPKDRRPGLVVSCDKFQLATSMVLVCPVTTDQSGFPLHLRLPDSFDEVHGCVATEQVRALDLTAENARVVASLDPNSDFMQDVLSVVRSFF